MMMTIIFISPLDVWMHTIHFVWAQWLWPPPPSTSSISRHVHFALFTLSPFIFATPIYYVLFMWQMIVFNHIFPKFRRSQYLCARWYGFDVSVKSKAKTTIVTSNQLQGCTIWRYEILTVSAWLHRVRLPEFHALFFFHTDLLFQSSHLKGKYRIHCAIYFYHYITTVHSRLLLAIYCHCCCCCGCCTRTCRSTIINRQVKARNQQRQPECRIRE